MMKNNNLFCVSKFENLGKGKYRIIFDNGVTCQVYGSEIRRFKLEDGSCLSEEQYSYLLKEVVGKRAKKRAIHLLEQMDRTEQQLREKLRTSEYPEMCIEEAVAYVRSFHYLDDARYAENFTRYRKENLSKSQIRQKLMSKGVKQETISQAIEEEYDVDESKHIQRLLEKKKYDNQLADTGETRRMYHYLLRRGFRSADILKEMKLYDGSVAK